MLNYNFKTGEESKSVIIRIMDNTTGLPDDTIVFNTAGLVLNYRREGSINVAITPVTLATLATAYASGGLLNIGNGYYRLDISNAALLAGTTGVLIHGTVTDKTIYGCYVHLETKIITDLNDFDPENDVVANVTLTDACTTNADMRGTDAALTDKADFALSSSSITAVMTALKLVVVDDGGATDKTLLSMWKDLVSYLIGNKTKSAGVHTYLDLAESDRIVAEVNETTGSRTMTTRSLD